MNREQQKRDIEQASGDVIQRREDKDGIEIGYAMIATSVFSFDIVTITLGLIVASGSCCASQYQISDKRKKWAKMAVGAASAKFVALIVLLILYMNHANQVSNAVNNYNDAVNDYNDAIINNNYNDFNDFNSNFKNGDFFADSVSDRITAKIIGGTFSSPECEEKNLKLQTCFASNQEECENCLSKHPILDLNNLETSNMMEKFCPEMEEFSKYCGCDTCGAEKTAVLECHCGDTTPGSRSFPDNSGFTYSDDNFDGVVRSANAYGTGIVVVFFLNAILSIMCIVFSCLYTCQRGY